jgi:hypothetical protein
LNNGFPGFKKKNNNVDTLLFGYASMNAFDGWKNSGVELNLYKG